MKPRTSGTQYSDTFAVWKKTPHSVYADWVCTDNIVNDYIKCPTLLPGFMNVHWSKLCCATASVCTDENFKLICRDRCTNSRTSRFWNQVFDSWDNSYTPHFPLSNFFYTLLNNLSVIQNISVVKIRYLGCH